MSGRERLRRGWLRFGKVGYKPNKDGKNRLCLEKNRCREEEGFPVVKGISKRVIVVKSPDPKIFEQAIFIIREDFAGQSGVSEKDVLREARAAANSYLGGGKRTTGKLFARLRAPLYAAAGAIAAPILFASLMPRSTMRPTVAPVTYGPRDPRPTTQHPAAVAVHCAVGVRWPP